MEVRRHRLAIYAGDKYFLATGRGPETGKKEATRHCRFAG
jgi:hypothetical protein